MKVVLINPPIDTASRSWYPIGIGYIAAVLQNAGFDVELIDLIGENLSRQDFKARLRATGARCFGIGGIITALNSVLDIAGYIREYQPEAFIFAGNTVAYTIPEIILRHSAVNAVVMGEGELTAVELLRARERQADLQPVPGLFFRGNGGDLVQTPARDPLPDLDALPFPAWDLMPLENYFRNARHRYCVISTVRGCPYACTYCVKTFKDYKVRYRTAASIMAELLAFHDRYRIDSFYFFDDLSTINKPRMLEFCRLKMASDLRSATWTISARANLLDEDIAAALKEAGCIGVGMGFESLDQEVLDSIGKKIKVEELERAVAICRKYRLSYRGTSFMIGAVNESEDAVRKSRDFCRRHGLTYEPHFMTPMPGSPLYDYAKAQGLIPDDLAYLKKLSHQGNTNFLLVNLTQNFSAAELENLRARYLYFPEADPANLVWKYLFSVMKNTVKYLLPHRRLRALRDHLARGGWPGLLRQELQEIKGIFQPPPVYRGTFERYSNIWE